MRHGDPLLFDFGATFGGYCADITRTVFLGEVSDEHRDFYAVVQAANEAGRQAAKPRRYRRIRRSCHAASFHRRRIRSANKASHRSRSSACKAHEAPYIVEGNERLLEPGMVFTIEPGIYRMGEIGIRIEDNVLITTDGCESLTSFPRSLQIV